jgi:hypothetical protein
MLELYGRGGFVDFLAAWTAAFEEVFFNFYVEDFATGWEVFGEGGGCGDEGSGAEEGW